MASSLRVNSIIPSSGTNVAIGTAGGTITYNANVTGVSTFTSGIVVSVGSTEALRTDSNSNIGIKTTSTSGFNGACDDVVISGSADVGLTIFSTSTTGSANIAFTDTIGSTTQGAINYVHNGDYMIFQTGASERMRIDSNGRILMPYQPAFHAYNTTGNNITNGNIVDFTTTLVNIGSHYNTSTSRFTAPVAGTYYFYAQLLSEDSTVSTDFRFNVNGGSRNGAYSGAGTWTSGNGFKTATGATVLTLAASDVVDVRSVGTSTIHADAAHTYFVGYLIG